jgi:xanthine dehydrogenase large subunit
MLQARGGAFARVEYDELPAILDIRTALEQKSSSSDAAPAGDPAARSRAAAAPRGSVAIGARPLRSRADRRRPAAENAGMLVYSSTQHPTEVQHKVAHALAVTRTGTVQCRRGRRLRRWESRPALMARAAVLAVKTGRPVKLRMTATTTCWSRASATTSSPTTRSARPDGRILALAVTLASLRLLRRPVGPVNDRAVCHVDNCYWLEHVEIVSTAARRTPCRIPPSAASADRRA